MDKLIKKRNIIDRVTSYGTRRKGREFRPVGNQTRIRCGSLELYKIHKKRNDTDTVDDKSFKSKDFVSCLFHGYLHTNFYVTLRQYYSHHLLL